MTGLFLSQTSLRCDVGVDASNQWGDGVGGWGRGGKYTVAGVKWPSH